MRDLLTKSLFRLALECPRKAHYARHARYLNADDRNEQLKNLAFGGLKVGEFARAMYRAGDAAAVAIAGDLEAQLASTASLLRAGDATLFEATFRHGNLMARVDILRKRGNVIDLIEVKSAGWDPTSDSLTGRGRGDPLSPKWRTQVFDVAFQHYLLERALPELLSSNAVEVRPWLLFLNRSAICSVDGLALKFPIRKAGRNSSAYTMPDFDARALEESLFVEVDARDAVGLAVRNEASNREASRLDFRELIEGASKIAAGQSVPPPQLGPRCRTCAFYAEPATASDERRSGWSECMAIAQGCEVVGARDESIFALRGRAELAPLLSNGHLWLRDVTPDELPEPTGAQSKVSRELRHRLQVREAAGEAGLLHADRPALIDAIRRLRFPLHFIDFETARPPIPYYRGHRPHQTILFQFSHHVVEEGGSVRHASEFLQFDAGEPPSIAAVRALKKSIGGDAGSVLHWFPHERTVLREIKTEIAAGRPEDGVELIEFLRSLGLSEGEGRLVDFGSLVERSIYLSGSGGGTSMKRFLRAVLRSSAYLQSRYSRPVYGSAEIPSRNFPPMAWVVRREPLGVVDPYLLLDPLFADRETGESLKGLEQSEGSVVANGAAAMLAFDKLLRRDVPPETKAAIAGQLRRYCELDTLAMVLVYEWLRYEVLP